MQIQNPKLAGKKLTLRFSVDKNGNRVSVAGDGHGVFDVPERDGTFLLRTPGWRPVRERAAAKADGPAKPPQVAPEGGEGGEGGEDAESLADAIEGLRKKVDALAMMEHYRKEGFDIPVMTEDDKLEDMKAALLLALIEE